MNRRLAKFENDRGEVNEFHAIFAMEKIQNINIQASWMNIRSHQMISSLMTL